MKASTKDQATGKLDRLKGKMKEIAGIFTGSSKLEGKGKRQRLTGAAREKLGDVKKVAGK